MKPYVLQIDDFFRHSARVRLHAVTRLYVPWTDDSPAGESEVYPNVSLDVPAWVQDEVKANLVGIMGWPIDLKFVAFRLNKSNTPQPHWAHTDIGIGQYSLVVYLTDDALCTGGTVFLRHRENGMETNPTTLEEEALWRQDQKIESQWECLTSAPMRFNRAVIAPANLFHASIPQGGFGSTALDGRLSLVGFFNRSE